MVNPKRVSILLLPEALSILVGTEHTLPRVATWKGKGIGFQSLAEWIQDEVISSEERHLTPVNLHSHPKVAHFFCILMLNVN